MGKKDKQKRQSDDSEEDEGVSTKRSQRDLKKTQKMLSRLMIGIKFIEEVTWPIEGPSYPRFAS